MCDVPTFETPLTVWPAFKTSRTRSLTEGKAIASASGHLRKHADTDLSCILTITSRNSNLRSVTYDAATPIARRGLGRSTSFHPDVPAAHASLSREPGYMDTPTQAHRYYAIPRSYPMPQELPTAESKLDRLMSMVQMLMDDTHDLKQDNQELKERVAFLESNTPHSATTSSRGITARRGKTTRSKARSRRQITAHDYL